MPILVLIAKCGQQWPNQQKFSVNLRNLKLGATRLTRYLVTRCLIRNCANVTPCLFIKANEEDNAAEESTVEVTGHPSSTSTPRHLHGVTFLACSSGLEDPEMGCGLDGIGGAKPKRSLKFLSDASHPAEARITSFFTVSKPRKEFVATLTAIFNDKAIFKAIFNDKAAVNRPQSILKQKSSSPPEDLLEPCIGIGDTFNDVDHVSREVQCNELD